MQKEITTQQNKTWHKVTPGNRGKSTDHVSSCHRGRMKVNQKMAVFGFEMILFYGLTLTRYLSALGF